MWGFLSIPVTVQLLQERGPVWEIRQMSPLSIWKLIFLLACQRPLGLFDVVRYLIQGASRIPGPPQLSSMAIWGAGTHLSSHLQWPVCLQARHGREGSFSHFWAGWLIFEAFPLAGFTSRWWLRFLGPLGLSWGCKALLTAVVIAWALVCLFLCQDLSSSSAWSRLLNTPIPPLGVGTSGFVGLIVTFGVSDSLVADWLMTCCRSRDWRSTVEGSTLVNFLQASTRCP